MVSEKPSRVSFVVLACFLALSFNLTGFGQIDPDPNSPEPLLLTGEGTPRALATSDLAFRDRKITESRRDSFEPGTKVNIFATNFQFLEGEGANSLRVYGMDRQGRQYRFPVLDVSESKRQPNVFAVTILLIDEIGYWPMPENGDLALYLTWRGLASNKVIFGFGGTGGLPDDMGIIPVPLSSVRKAKGSTNRFIRPQNSKSGPSLEYVGYRWSGDRARFLEQAGFGPTQALDTVVRRNGIRQYLVQQFAAQYPSVSNPYPNQPLKPATPPADCDGDQTVTPDVPATCARDTYTMYPLQTWFHREAFYGEPQLRHRIAWALSQIWVTSGLDILQSRHMVEYHKVLSANAFGNFRDLMEQMTFNPTMGDYLDMRQSTKNNPNENYARELMQLFTVGLFKVNQDGTVQCVENNPCLPGDTPIPTYDQEGVNNLTKVLTGWSFCNVQASCPNIAVGTVNYIDPLLFNAGVTTLGNNRHDLTAKTLLSYPGSTTTDIAACTGTCDDSLANIAVYANSSADQALDNIFNHPNVGPFIGKILIQQMVTSNPTPAYVSRVAAAFNNNGLGVRGDMKAVVRAILLDPEARGDAKTDPNYGKLREPVQLATNFFRHFKVRSADGLAQSDGYLNGRGEYTGMGQDPFRSPTVFNYYPPDNIIPGTALPGPEFALMTTGTAITRANFANRMLSGFTNTFPIPAASIPVPISLPNAPNGTSFDFSDLQALAAADTTGNLLVDELNRRMMHGTMSATMKSTILTAVTNIPATSDVNFLQRARQAVYLVTTSSQYQIQR